MSELVLIVDDNANNLKLARDVLEFAGFPTLEWRPAVEGVALAQEHLPDSRAHGRPDAGPRRNRRAEAAPGRPADGGDPRRRAHLARPCTATGALPRGGLRRLPREADQRQGVPRPGCGGSCGSEMSAETEPARASRRRRHAGEHAPARGGPRARGFCRAVRFVGPEALERVVAELPDLVLLDVQMAGMNGYEVCRRIRENEATALLPVVMLTSHDSEARIDGIRAGADDFVTKPFDQQELLAPGRVRSCGSSATTTRSARRRPSSPSGTGTSRSGSQSRWRSSSGWRGCDGSSRRRSPRS